MKKASLFLSVAIAALFTFSCSSLTEKASEKISEKVLESVIGHDAEIELDEDGSGTITIKGENGEEITLSSNTQKIPDNFPSDVYLVKGEIIAASSVNTGGGDLITISMNTDEKASILVEDIAKNMKDNGWSLQMNTSTPEASILIFSKGKKGATVTVGIDNGKTVLSYMVTL